MICAIILSGQSLLKLWVQDMPKLFGTCASGTGYFVEFVKERVEIDFKDCFCSQKAIFTLKVWSKLVLIMPGIFSYRCIYNLI
jgi:hypothetical protein